MLQLKKIVGKVLSSNMYILYEEGISYCYLIDIGDFASIMEELPRGMKVRGVFLTHTHFDHIAGINDLCKMFPDCTVYTSEYGKEALHSDKKNFSLYHERSVVFDADNEVIVLHDADAMPLFEDACLQVLATPGHCPSCLTYYTKWSVFTGDSYIPNIPVVSKLPMGDRMQASISRDRIINMAGTREICAGHDVDKWISVF